MTVRRLDIGEKAELCCHVSMHECLRMHKCRARSNQIPQHSSIWKRVFQRSFHGCAIHEALGSTQVRSIFPAGRIQPINTIIQYYLGTVGTVGMPCGVVDVTKDPRLHCLCAL